MSFVCDAMLGRTARFLRLFGYDTLYSNTYSDSELLRIASEEKRILLTRDLKLHQHALKQKIPSFLLYEKTYIDRIASLVMQANLKLDLTAADSRCSNCNTIIMPISKQKIKGKVPEKTYLAFNEFWICPNRNCGKIYYQGQHWDNITKAFKQIIEKIEEKRRE
ncbi:MAG TPA: Mut7-C RNAse domain-containing protein [Candidatus Deferrimicrobium sp.]|nr:Mut7-C RNAse domain-containing protein [Candidatus Deferrimicrobium sp.]